MHFRAMVVAAILPVAVLAQEGSIGYSSVDAALQALKARSDVSIRVESGWTIVDERSASAIWSFTPPGHPAHPAAIKRTIVMRDGAAFIQMSALCQAEKAPCDRLMAEFKELNERMGQAIRREKQRPQSVVASSNRDAAWRPSPQQVELIERQTLAYFTAKDAGKYEEAYAYLSEGQKQHVPFARWTSIAGEMSTKAGAVQGRALRRITWYKDPPNVAAGIYAAVDFSGQFVNAALHCGYVAWHEQPDGRFLLVREEETIVDKATEQKMKPGDLEGIRAKYCR